MKISSIKGFALLEMLAVIAIISILAVIAVPSFLHQASNSKETEARQNLALALRSQQEYYQEFNIFADSWNQLDTGLKSATENYTYELFLTKEKGTGVLVNQKNRDLNSYIGGVKFINNKQGIKFITAQCKSIKQGDTLTTESLLVSANQIRCGKRVDDIK